MLCIPILSRNTEEALEKIARAEPLADLLEIRLDFMEEFDLREIVKTASRPVMVTYRSRREGGRGSADYGTRVRYLSEAVEVGADYVDVEFGLPLESRQGLFQSRGKCEVIVSNHLLNRTPPQEVLEEVFKKMAATGADIVKIITRARTVEDNLRVLALIPLSRGLGIKIITFCMGPLGRVSRILSPLMGGYLSFASLEEGEESADGQLPADKMKGILEALTS